MAFEKQPQLSMEYWHEDEYQNEVCKQPHPTADDEYQNEDCLQSYLSVDDEYQNEVCKKPHLTTDDEYQNEDCKQSYLSVDDECQNEVCKQLDLTSDDEYQDEDCKQSYLSMDDEYQNEVCKQLHLTTDDEYQNEDCKQSYLSVNDEYHDEEFKNGLIAEKASEVWNMDSSVHGKAELETFRCENADQDYECVISPNVLIRRLPEKEVTTEQALFSSKANKWRDGRRTCIMFVYILALISLITAEATLVMTLLRCFPSCNFGWHLFQEKCYYYSSAGETWGKASHNCHDLDADLVVIDNEKEQDFLVYKMNDAQPHWIGLSDIQTEGVWKWVDGTPVSYRNWYPSEPNNQTMSGENCAVLMAVWPHMWNIKACPRSFSYICEKNMQLACVWQSF